MDPTQQQSGQRPGHTANIYVAPQVTHAYAGGSGPNASASAGMRPASTKPSGPQVNWGGIVKGALIVTAVVAVGVVGFMALSGVATSAMAAAAAGQTGVMASVGAGLNGMASAGTFMFEAGSSLAQMAWNGLTGFVTNFGSGFMATAPESVTSAMASTAAAAPTAAATGAAANSVGLAGGAAAAMAATPLAMKQLSQINLLDHGSMMHDPASTGDSGVHAAAAKKSTVIHQQPTQNFADAAPSGAEHGAGDLLDESVAASSKAMKMGQHAADDSHEYQRERAHAALARSRTANRSWAERTGGPREPVRPIESRASNSFTENLEADQLRTAQLATDGRA